ncbi:MAG: hypothetical protein H7Y32_16295 [Chloroflexales bacterium]|nr:hypothetical protein [Chloroflexales bacterium]
MGHNEESCPTYAIKFVALENSRILKRVDAQPVWSVVCFFVTKAYRNQGAPRALLRGAVDYATAQGA